jgi:hypothetical protein
MESVAKSVEDKGDLEMQAPLVKLLVPLEDDEPPPLNGAGVVGGITPKWAFSHQTQNFE